MTISSSKFLEQYSIFIGSSFESKVLVELIVEELKELISSDQDDLKLKVVPWYEHFEDDAELINTLFLEEFPNVLEECEYSLFIISQDDLLIKRNSTKKTVRDNVWFEAGMFMGKRGRNRTFFFLNTNEFSNLHFPTDMTGLTLPGVKWNSEVAKMYFEKNILFKKQKNANDAVEKKIKSEIKRVIKKLLVKIKSEIRKQYVSEEAIIIYDRKRCFTEGIKLVNNAQDRLYTTISFERSLSPNPTVDELTMQKALEAKISEKEPRPSFRRYLKKSLPKIYNQWTELETVIEKTNQNSKCPYLYDFDFDYLEMIISDNNVLMVFPDYRGGDETLHEKVAFGFLIKENKVLSEVLSSWLIKKLCK